MTNQEIIKRLGMLDIRDAEPEDYAALYLAIQIVIEKAKEPYRQKEWKNERFDRKTGDN